VLAAGVGEELVEEEEPEEVADVCGRAVSIALASAIGAEFCPRAEGDRGLWLREELSGLEALGTNQSLG